MIDQQILTILREKLIETKTRIEGEFAENGILVDPVTNDWSTKIEAADDAEADHNSMSDRVEDFENNTTAFAQIEIEYRDVLDALEKMEVGNYGVCEISGHPIEIDRLMAYPAARTCKAHMNGF